MGNLLSTLLEELNEVEEDAENKDGNINEARDKLKELEKSFLQHQQTMMNVNYDLSIKVQENAEVLEKITKDGIDGSSKSQ